MRFEVGDAETLPFDAESFDIVTNLESSSCYPDVHAFYREVHRVLAPGGHFLYSDCLPANRFREATPTWRKLACASSGIATSRPMFYSPATKSPGNVYRPMAVAVRSSKHSSEPLVPNTMKICARAAGPTGY